VGEFEKSKIRRLKRKMRTRGKVFGAPTRPRLSVTRTNKHVYAQVIDDLKEQTLAQASTLDRELRGKIKGKTLKERSKEVGLHLASRCKKKKIDKVAFDKGRFSYHGCIKNLADGAREGGLKF
jgi:large subunit ribosomal protein L18